MKYMQAPVTTTLFYPLLHYKALQPQGECDKQYWKEISITFLEKKHNTNIIRKYFPIEMYMGEPPYESYFIALILKEKLVIRPTKKLVVSYVVEDLVLLD